MHVVQKQLFVTDVFSKTSSQEKVFGEIANGIWTNYSGVCAPLRHNLALVQTYCTRARHVESK